MLEKWPLLDENHALTLLEKCQFFEFLNFLCLLLKSHFPNQYCLKKKGWKNGHISTKPWVNPFAKTSIF